MKGRFLTALAMIPLAATLAVGGPEGEGGERGGHRRGGHGWMPGPHGEDAMRIREHLGELGLSAEQQKKVDAIYDAAKKDRGSRGQLGGEYKKLHELLDAEKPDPKAVNAQVDKIGAMKTEHHKAMLKTLLAVRAELTPEQRAKLKEMKASKRDNWRRERRGKGGEDKPKGEPKEDAADSD
ncbi:MAG: Spy/CpxP family protein refolding chaperone [Candidatus Binatia bacterium]